MGFRRRTPKGCCVWNSHPRRKTEKMEARVRRREQIECSSEGLRLRLSSLRAEGSRVAKGKRKKKRFLVAPLAHLLPPGRFHTHILGYSLTPSQTNVLSEAEKRTVCLSRACLWTFLMCACGGTLVMFLAREGKLF